MTTLETRIGSSWLRQHYWPCVAEVRCAAALAATGHMTSVNYMQLNNLELPSSEDMLSLFRVVSYRVMLDNVTGDIGPLLYSLTCDGLQMFGMELDQAATCSMVSKLVEISHITGDIAPLLSSLSCSWLKISGMELDQAATSGLVVALQHGVKKLELGCYGPVRLHIQTLMEYDGRGRCGEVEWRCSDTVNTYRKEIMTWADRINWSVTDKSEYVTVMNRK